MPLRRVITGTPHDAVAQRRGYTIGGVGRRGRGLEPELLLDHEAYLIFGRIPISHHGLLDLPGGVLGDRNIAERSREQYSPTGMSELEGTLHVLSLEDVLHHDDRGCVARDQRGDLFEDLSNSNRQRLARRCTHHPALHQGNGAAALLGDNAVPGDGRSRIDPENQLLAHPTWPGRGSLRRYPRWTKPAERRRCRPALPGA